MTSSGSSVTHAAGLPRRLQGDELDIAHPEGEAWNKSMRVLVIEDDKETALFLQKSLKENGHTADLAADGAQPARPDADAGARER